MTLATIGTLILWAVIALGGAFLLTNIAKRTNDLALYIAKGWANFKINKTKAMAAIGQTVRHIAPDEHGLLGVIVRGDGSVVNLDDQVLMLVDERIATALTPVNEQMVHMRRLMAALPPHIEQATVERLVEGTPQIINPLPDRLPLASLLDGKPSIDRVPLGQYISPNGLKTVTAPLGQLVHLMVAGQTGSGKSSAIKSWAYYLWSTEQVDLGLIDLGRVTFSRFRDAGLQWPIATTPGMAVALLREFHAEMDRRLELMEQHKGVENIWQYNRAADRSLRPLVVFVDELPDLMDVPGAEEEIGAIVRAGRKAGTWLWFAGTNFHAAQFPTRYRSNVLYKACMHSDHATGQVIVGTRDVAQLEAQGRALVELPFQFAVKQGLPTNNGPLEFQLPMIPDGDPLWRNLDQMLPPRHQIAEAQVSGSKKEQRISHARRIVHAWQELPEDKRSITAVAKKVWPGKIKRSASGNYYHQVVDALTDAGLMTR